MGGHEDKILLPTMVVDTLTKISRVHHMDFGISRKLMLLFSVLLCLTLLYSGCAFFTGPKFHEREILKGEG